MSNLGGLVNELQRKLFEKEAKIKNLEAQLRKINITMEGSNLPAADDPVKLHQKIVELDENIQKLKAQLAEFHANMGGPGGVSLVELVKDLQIKLKKKDEELSRLRPNGDRSSLNPPEFDYRKVQQKMAEQDAEIQRLRGEITSEKVRASKSEKIGQMSDLVKELQSKIQLREQEIKLLKQSSMEHASQSEVSEENKRLGEENRVLTEKLAKMHIQIQDLTEELSKKNADLVQLQKSSNIDALRIIQTERDTLKKQLTLSEKQIKSMQIKIATLEKEQDTTGSRQQMLRIRELKSILDSMKRQIRLQNQELVDIKNKNVG